MNTFEKFDPLRISKRIKKACAFVARTAGNVDEKRKLRKREEHSSSVHPVADAVVLQTTTTTTAATNGNATTNGLPPQVIQTDTTLTYRGQFLWAYPPQTPQQLLYNDQQNNIVQTERPGFVRGFRKNLGGRWRRLVKRKPPTEVYTIPAELKPQLKQIYVY